MPGTGARAAQAIADTVPAPVRPSTSSVASLIAGAGVTVLVWIVEQFLPQPIPGQVVGALVTLGTVGVGFFFSGGRSDDTV